MTQYYAAAGTLPRRNVSAGPGWRRNQNTVAFKMQRGLGPVASTVMVILLLSVLGLIYLTQLTKTGTYGYQINDIEQKRQEMLNEKKDLEVENARLQALEKVRQSPVAQTMTTPETTAYKN